MDALHITERLILPGTIAAALIMTAAGLWRDDPSGMQAMAGITERVMVQNGRVINELHAMARKDRAARVTAEEALRAAQARLATLEASLAAQIRKPLAKVVNVTPVKRKRRRR